LESIRKSYVSPPRYLTQKAEMMLQNITFRLPDSLTPLSLVSRGADKGSVLVPPGERILFY
jgi:hypothetical protein